MSTRNLSVELRPRTFAALVGLDSVKAQIQAQLDSKRIPTAWMFVGPFGGGKTTVARILATAVQCDHSDGADPCEGCIAAQKDFHIIEVNASNATGVDEMRSLIESANYSTWAGKYRVFILDEAQKLSAAAQNLLLKSFEDAPPQVMWIICTTNPEKINKGLRTRCLTFQLPSLSAGQIRELLDGVLEEIGETADIDDLVRALSATDGITPRVAIMSLEKRLAGAEIDDCILPGSSTSVSTIDLCRAAINGDWSAASAVLSQATPDDAMALRLALAGYVKSVLLKSTGKRAQVCSQLINRLTDSLGFEPGLQFAALCSAVFDVCDAIPKRG